MNRIKDLVDSALNGQVVFHLALMLGTGFAANAAILPKVVEFGIPPKTAAILSAIVGMLTAVAIDGGFKKQLPYAVSVLFSKKDRATGIERKRGFNLIVLILVLITGGTSLFFNVKVTPEMTGAIIEAPDGAKQTALSATLSNKYDRDAGRLEKAVENAQERLQKAEAAAEQSELDAVTALGAKMASLVKQGNAWAIGQTNAAKRRARSRSRADISSAKKDLQSAETALATYISNSGAKVTEAQTALVQQYQTETVKVEQARTRWGSAFIVFWVVAFIGFIGCTVIVVVYEDETGEDITHNPTIFKVLYALVIRAKDAALSFIIRKGQLDFQYAMPTIGSYAPTPIAPRPAPMRRSSEPAQKTENRKSCNSGKCSTEDRNSVNRSTGNGTEANNRTEQKATEGSTSASDSDDRGEGWPTPDSDEWDKLVKRARGWFGYACSTTSQDTRERNLAKWEKFKRHAAAHGYKAAGNEATGKSVVTKIGPVELGGDSFEWSVSGNDEEE